MPDLASLRVQVQRLLALLLLLPVSLCAQQLSPQVLNEPTLDYPGPVDREALVELEFTVTRAGGVEDIDVIGGFYEPRFVEAAMTAVRQLRFTPAMADGQAVDWPGFRVSARFLYRNLFHTLFPATHERLQEIEQHLQQDDPATAEALARQVLADDTRLFFEYALINLRLAESLSMQERHEEADHHLDRALLAYLPGEHDNYGTQAARTHDRLTVYQIAAARQRDFGVTSLVIDHHRRNGFVPARQPPPQEQTRQAREQTAERLAPKRSLAILNNRLLESAYLRGIVIQAALGRVAKLLDHFDKLQALNDEAITPALAQQVTAVRALPGGSKPLRSRHLIRHGDTLFYPVYRTVAATAVEGSLESLDLQCREQTLRLPFQQDVEWTTPESLGRCALRFRGGDGTRFDLVQFSRAAQSP